MNRKTRRAEVKSQSSHQAGAIHSRSDQLFAELTRLFDQFNRGQISEAEKNALSITVRYPKEPLGWKLLGTIYTVHRRSQESLGPLNRSLRLAADDFEVHNSIGVSLQALGRLNEAVASFTTAISLSPQYADAHSNLGMALQSLGQFEAAAKSCATAVTLRPDYVEGYNNLAIVLQSLGRDDEAITTFKQAVTLRPTFVEALNNLALALLRTGRSEESIPYFKRVIDLAPNEAANYNNLGNALFSLRRGDEAIEAFNRAILHRKNFPEAYSNLGSCLKLIGKISEAIEAIKMSLIIDPNFADAHNNLGNVYIERGWTDQAIESYAKAVELRPDFYVAHSNLLFSLHYCDDISKEERFAAAIKFGQTLPAIVYSHNRRHGSEPKTRLRIGFVSPDLRVHPVAYFIENILSALRGPNPSALETFLYSTSPVEDHVSDRLRALSTRWSAVTGLSDDALARKIYHDEIDILIDLSGHTAQHRLSMFALKPAAVQVSWVGYFATTGVPAMDYFLSDNWLAPPDEEQYFTEKLWRLKSNACFTRPDTDVHVESIPALSNGYVTFGCFNHRSKITEQAVSVWAKILHEIPNSRLFLKSGVFEDAAIYQEMIAQFGGCGVGADRLIIEGPSPREDYLACYNRVDICLDPFPYPGGTTTLEALWMGTPVLTMKGDSYLSRVGECAAQHIGAPDWIATDTDDYVAKAVAFASDVEALATWSSHLRDRTLNSPLFDAQAMAQNFEEAMWGMWDAQAL